MSDKIKPQHLQRKALLYIRQSSPDQVLHNQESRRLQYAMKERLGQLGWQQIEVIDDDLGYTASGTITRQGFERMVAEVCLGKVGVVAARELSRFARNNREWQQLIEMCRVVDTLLLDKEMVYAPRDSNDRLLLGLKGSLNEYELDLLRARSVEARHAKARRGELVVSAPVGFLKTADQRLEKDPDRRVQEAILLVFRKFCELGSVRQTLLWFLDEGLQLPARKPDGAIVWKRPIYATVHRLLTNPIYGGAYAYGKTEAVISYVNGQARRAHRRRCPQQWLALIPEAHEGYISWEEFQKIQKILAENVQGWGRRGAVKRGAALLSGLLRCRRCGRKITVHYTGNRRGFLRYGCVRGRLDQGEPKCIAFGGIPVDEAIGLEILRVVQPGRWRQRCWRVNKSHMNKTMFSKHCVATWKRRAMKFGASKSNLMPSIPIIAWWPTNWNVAGTRRWSECISWKRVSRSRQTTRATRSLRQWKSSRTWLPISKPFGRAAMPTRV